MGRIKKPTQADRIYEYMQQHKEGITGLKAIRYCGCLDLQGRIRDLKERGIKISDEYIHVVTACGDRVRVKKYWLEGEN